MASGHTVSFGILAIGLALTAASPSEADTLVAVETVRSEEILEYLPLSGTVTSARVAPLSSEIAGKVARVDVEQGTFVEAGQRIVELDPALGRLALRQAGAAVDEAQAALDDALYRLGVAERLAGQQHMTENELRTRRAEVAIDEAVLGRLRAEMESQAHRLALHELRAPFAGVVSRRFTEAGAWVEPGTAVIELVDMQNLRIEVPVPQEYILRIGPQTRIAVTLDALPGQEFEARLQDAVPVGDVTARTFLVKVTLTDKRIRLMPGMSARIVFNIATGEHHPVVSRDGLIRYQDGRTVVWVIEDKDGAPVVAERQVELGVVVDGKLQIRAGIGSGDRIVIEGNEALQPGQSVRLREAS